MSDKECIAFIQNGDSSVFSDLYERHRELFFGFVRRNFRKSDDYIADLYQDSCVVLWQNITKGKLTPEALTSSIETYIIGVAKNILMARERSLKRIMADSPYEADDIEVERNQVIQSVVDRMGEPCATLLDKFYWEKLSGEEIAKLMNYNNADTVKTQKWKCMQKLKVTLTSAFKNLNLM